jgi:hypothetical protein
MKKGYVLLPLVMLHLTASEALARLVQVDATTVVTNAYAYTMNDEGTTFLPMPDGMNVNPGDAVHMRFVYEVQPELVLGDPMQYLLLENLTGGFSGMATINEHVWLLDSGVSNVTQASVYMNRGIDWHLMEWRINSYDEVADNTFPFSLGYEDITLHLYDSSLPCELLPLPLSIPTGSEDLNLAMADGGYAYIGSWYGDNSGGWEVRFAVPTGDNITISSTPIPPALWLLGSSLLGLLGLRKKFARKE